MAQEPRSHVPFHQIDELIEQNAQVNALLQQQAERSLTGLHRPLEQVGALLGRPAFLLSALGFFVLWIAMNLSRVARGGTPWDAPPFFWLQGLIGFLALLVTTIVLVSQARQAQIVEQRAQLSLQIALLTEQRTAKIIELLEELRRDLPSVPDRTDEEAGALAEASDPSAILGALNTLREGGEASLPPEREGG